MLMLPFVAQLLYRFLSDLDYVSPFLSFLQSIYEIQNSAIFLNTVFYQNSLCVMSVGIITHTIAKSRITSRSERTHFKVVCSPFAGLTPPPPRKKNKNKNNTNSTTTVPMQAIG